ncbi:MAG: glycine betaine ABC transporter substrate-binding protein [Oscillospiraceae bacterium]|jgi:glycine betaine/proline transport system substrate-binding protein|nr:glycine betaine ABC transporter substrate-binding protein [Oscillospiraceae bacterium]
MKKLSHSIVAALLTGVLCLSLFSGCSQDGGSDKDKTKPVIQIGYVTWAEDIAMTNLAQAVLEDKLGYEVKQIQADVAPLFASLAAGSTDFFLDCWLPVTHKDYMEKYGADIQDFGVSFENAKIGLVVPSYVDLNSIEQLNGAKGQFDGTIVGIDAGAGIMKATDTAISEYGLEYSLLSGSGPTMTAALKKAADQKAPIVVTGWQPHWMFSKWDLKFLDDPKGIYGDAESIHKLGRKGLDADAPEVSEFLTKFKMTGEQLGDLMGAVEAADDPLKAARTWMNDNKDVVSAWLPANA